jgi:hypothetical protein
MLALLAAPWRLYNTALERRPATTKSLTTGVMYCAGDVCAQFGDHWRAVRAAREAGEAPPPPFRLDWERAGVSLVYGTVIAGPLYHVWFDRLDRLPAAMYRLRQHRHRAELLRAYATLRRHGVDVALPLPEALPRAKPFHAWTEKAMKIAADQFIFSSLYTVVYYMSIGLMMGAVEVRRAEDRRHSVEAATAIIRDRLGRDTAAGHPAADGHGGHHGAGAGGAGASAAAAAGGAASGGGDSSSPASPRRGSLLRRDMLRIRSLLEASDVEDESIDRVLSLLEEEEAASRVAWRDVWDRSVAHLKDVYVQTWLADCAVWPPLQLVNFTFVPLRYQVLYVNACNLGWNTFLSFMANSKAH